MAKQNIKKIEILASIKDVKEIVDLIQRKGIIELSDIPDDDLVDKLSTSQSFGFYEKYLNESQSALKTLDRYCPQSKGLLESIIPQKENLSLSQYLENADKANIYLGYCYDINAAQKQIEESSTAVARYEVMLESLEPWLDLDVPMKYTGSKTTSAFIGTLPEEYSAETLRTALLPYLGEEERYECEVVSTSGKQSNVFIICHNDCKQAVYEALRSIGFAYPSDPTKHPPRVRYERYRNAVSDLKEKSEKALETIKENAKYRREIEFAYDYFSLYKEKYSAISKLAITDNVFILNGFISERNVKKFTEELESNFTVAVSITEPQEDEDVPVELRNNAFTGAVEGITNMYSPPGKSDIDPNPVMAFFYYALFGIMLSDAGYGLLMVIGTSIAKTKMKLEGAMKKTVDMYFYCGIATVFWGALFGSWFGDIFEVVARDFFGVADLGAKINEALGFTVFRSGLALWFQPVQDPMRLMRYSFLFGIIHLFAGLFASFYKMWKAGNKIGAFCDVIPVFLLITGICPVGAGILSVNVPASLKSAGLIMAAAGAVLIVLTAGRDSKNIVGKLGLGLYGLYNTASGWMSDILSYSRLLALGLCTGVIASVVNTMGTIPGNKIAKACLLVPVFLFGHVVNMAINLIGTYVHTNRLQYVEFFAKFYEGGGRTFTPLRTNTKYYNIKED